jgi:hypothetical protein
VQALHVRRHAGGSEPVCAGERERDSREALDAHYQSDAFADFQFGLDGLLARPSALSVYSGEGAIRPLNTGPIDPRDAD